MAAPEGRAYEIKHDGFRVVARHSHGYVSRLIALDFQRAGNDSQVRKTIMSLVSSPWVRDQQATKQSTKLYLRSCFLL